jgi:outer membrane lipoprotein-sorting protein
MFLYWPGDNQVMVTPVPPDDQAPTAVLFLAGKGNLTRDFSVTYAPGASGDRYALRLQPRLPQAEYDWLQVDVDRETLQIRSLTTGDAQGGRSTFELSNFKENPGLSDKAFVFKIPRGADVISNGSPSR